MAKLLVSIVVAFVLSISLCSCENLQKKFIRQKKKGQETKEFQPVLEPQEYPAPENNPVENYKQHYDLIKAWYRDLWTGVDEKNSDGMVRYSLKQIFDHIEQMKPLLKSEKSQSLDQLAALLKYYQASLDQPRIMRNYSRIQSDLRAFSRMLRDQFRDDKIQGDYINQ